MVCLKSLLTRFSVLINYTMQSSNHFSTSSCFPRFFMVQVFIIQVFQSSMLQSPGFSECSFFTVQVFQGPGPDFRSSREKMFQKIYSRCGDTWVFSCFLSCNIRFLLLKQQQKSNQFDFFFVSATKNFRKKVAKQRNLTWGDVGTFNGHCNIFRFSVAITYNLFPCPLSFRLILISFEY